MTSRLTGTKTGSGVAERIISEFPLHRVLIEPFWGRGSIARKTLPADVTLGCDLDDEAIEHGRAFATMYHTCGIEWLKSYFELIRAGEHYTAPSSWLSVLGYTAAEHFVYIDPPYWNVRPYYRHVLTEGQHRDVCRVFRALPCPAAISGYHSDLYDGELAGCRCIAIRTRTRRSTVDEVVWFNYSPPAVYHDVRFLGIQRRERERIKRRRRRWRAGLERMSPAERQAVLEGCLLAAVPPGAAADALRASVLGQIADLATTSH